MHGVTTSQRATRPATESAPAASTRQPGPEVPLRGTQCLSFDAATSDAPRVRLPGRRLDLVRRDEGSAPDAPLGSRRSSALDYLLEAQFGDEPDKPLSGGGLRYAFVVPPGCPPGLRAYLEIGDHRIELNSGPVPMGEASRSLGGAAAPWQPSARDRVIASQLVEDGYLPIPMTRSEPGPRGAQTEPIYGYLKLFHDTDEMSPDEDAGTGGRTAGTRPGEPKHRASARTAPVSQQTPQAAIPLATGSVPVSVPASVLASAGEGRKRTIRTSIVAPDDFPPGVTIRIRIGDRVREVTSGPDGSLREAGEAAVEGKGQGNLLPPLDGKRIAALKAAGYSPFPVEIPHAGGTSPGGASTKTYTIYFKAYVVDETESPAEGQPASGGTPPAESRRQHAAKLRKQKARRNAALRQRGVPATTATSASSSSSASAALSAAHGQAPGAARRTQSADAADRSLTPPRHIDLPKQDEPSQE